MMILLAAFGDIDDGDVENGGNEVLKKSNVSNLKVEYRTVDGVELLVMKKSMDYYGYEVDSGEMHIMYDY